jgi:hypothetical protein
VTEGIAVLREQRGHQLVSFSEIADHLFDYVERHPHDAVTVDRLSRFLTAVEMLPHDHNADPDRGLPAPYPAAADTFV